LSDRPVMIDVQGVSRRFGQFLAVDSVSFALPAHQVIGFLGPNGAGKTTTIRMIAGSLAPSAGTITVAGFDVLRQRRQAQSQIGYLPESAPLYTEMRVREFLKFRAQLFGLGSAKRNAAIDRVVKSCWLGEVQTRPINQLSKGYRQRVGLAAALLHQPKVVILDEPTVGLDPSQIREVRSLIRELAAEHTVLLSTHILPEVELSCDRVIMIARGRVRADGTLESLRQAANSTGRYVVEVDSSDAHHQLRSLDCVLSSESLPLTDRWHRISIVGKSSAGDIRPALAASLKRCGCTVRELRSENPSLEHLFVQMAADAEAERADLHTRPGRHQAGSRGVAA
jgi:ABC-2 type transport system ATP-binding protein